MNKTKPVFAVSSSAELASLALLRPRHTHDSCSRCRFIGYADQLGHPEYGTCDVYVCAPTEGDPELIIRYGRSGPEYLSMPAQLAALCDSPVYVAASALRRACEAAGGKPDWVGLALRAA